MENQETRLHGNPKWSSNSQLVHLLSVPSPLSNQYPYSPLSLSHNEIRILQARSPFDVNGLISCTLSHVSLDQNPRYEALSYTWADRNGSSRLSKQVLLDDYVVSVTQNLEAALRVLLTRSHSDDSDKEQDKAAPALWVDALCINQTDILERNAQVSKMNSVYRRAQGVIAWLGEEYDGSRDAFQLLRTFRARGVQEGICDELDPSWAPGMALPDSMIRKTYAVVRLFRREYWARAWVVQEVALAQRLVLHCGDEHMVMEDMIAACRAVFVDAIWMTEAFSSSGIGHLLIVLTQEGPNVLVRVEREDGAERGKLPHVRRENKLDVTLGELLVQHRAKKAADPRDKIYSLLGMVTESTQNRIPVDYSLDVRSLFQKVAVFVATEEQQYLQILAENKRPLSDTSDTDGCFRFPPSWVPDWANSNKADKVRIDRIIRWASASGPHASDAFIREVDILCVKGLRIGTITQVGPMMQDLDCEELIFAPVFDVLYEWWLIFLAAGKEDLIGPQGFVNFLFLGDLHRYEKFTTMEIESVERNIVDHLRVVMKIYRPDDETLISLVGRQIEDVDDNVRRKAETDLWGITPLVRKRKAFFVAGVECGIGPQCIEEGDMVVVALGCNVPLVLHKRTEEDCDGYVNLGDAYVNGLMNGEAANDLAAGRRRLEIFELH